MSEPVLDPVGIDVAPADAATVWASPKRFLWMRTMASEAWRLGRTKAGVIIVVIMVLMAIFGPLIAPYSPTELVTTPYAAPSSGVWLGGDSIGRDVLSRVLCGGRTVISLALAATAIGFVLGVTFGLVAGYSKRVWDETIMRLLDVVLAFPQLVLTLLFVSIVGPKLWLIVLLVGVSHAPRIARVTRAATVDVAQRDFVHSAEALGVSRTKILFGEILPNISSPLLVEFGLRLTYSIGLIAALSFMGFGMQPPTADWGLMINENRNGILLQPLAVAAPVICIAVLTIGTNFIADGLDRALAGIDRDTSGN
jgi:peptide/nickel transport system permease protein